jgi:hypothetical protein
MANSLTTKNLQGFKTRLKGGGARPNLFEVSIPTFPTAVTESSQANWNVSRNNELRFLCKAAQLPASTVAEVPVPFRGRILKVAGDRTFEPWTITIINDENFRMRSSFEAWMNTISDLSHATGVTNPSSYMTDAYVYQLGRGAAKNAVTHSEGNLNQSILRSYKFLDVFPTEVSSIDLSYDSSDTIEEFSVTLQVQEFSIGIGEDGRSDSKDGKDKEIV